MGKTGAVFILFPNPIAKFVATIIKTSVFLVLFMGMTVLSFISAEEMHSDEKHVFNWVDQSELVSKSQILP